MVDSSGVTSGITLFLFAMLMDKLTDYVRRDALWTRMFADDIVISGESREEAEENLERWRICSGVKKNESQQEEDRITRE